MSKKQLIIISILLTLFITLLSGCAYTNTPKDAQSIIAESDQQQQQQNNDQTDKKDENENIDQSTIRTNTIINMLQSSDEVYLESTLGADYLVYLSEEDKNALKEILSGSNVNKEKHLILNNQFFDYAIHLQDKNTKIYVDENNIFIEDILGSSGFSVDEEKLATLLEELEHIYLSYINQYIKSMEPDEIIIEAVDKEQKKVFNSSEFENFKPALTLTKIIDSKDMDFNPVVYPYYKITFMSDIRNAVLTLVNDHVVCLEIWGEDSYFEYQPELLSHVEEHLTQQEDRNDNIFAELFNAKVIKILENEEDYAIDNNDYYRLAIIRTLMKSEKMIVHQIRAYQTVKLELHFEVGDKIERVFIYDDYIKYRGKIYKIETIANKLYTILEEEQ